MSDTTTGNGEQQQNGTGGAGGGDGQQSTSTASAASTGAAQTPDQTANTTTTGGSQAGAEKGEQQQTNGGNDGGKDDSGKTFTQADLDRIINDRLTKQQDSMKKQFAQALGIEDPNAETDPAKLLEQQKSATSEAQKRADAAEAKSLALAAGVKPDRVDRFAKLVDVDSALKDVDRSDSSKVSEALNSAVASTLEDVPEFKASSANVPSTSGGDRSTGDNGKPVYTRDQIKNMSREDLVEKSDELTQAMAEGRIKG